MVATRRRRIPEVVPDSTASPEPSVRDIDVEPLGLRAPSVASAESSPSASPSASPSPAPSLSMPPSAHTTRSASNQSATSFAGPGQRGAQSLSVAPSSARISYLNAFENMNDEFATQLRSRGVPLPGGKHFSSLRILPPCRYMRGGTGGICGLCGTPTHLSPTFLRLRGFTLAYAFALASHTHARWPGIRIRVRILHLAYAFALMLSSLCLTLLTHSRLALSWYLCIHAHYICSHVKSWHIRFVHTWLSSSCASHTPVVVTRI